MPGTTSLTKDNLSIRIIKFDMCVVMTPVFKSISVLALMLGVAASAQASDMRYTSPQTATLHIAPVGGSRVDPSTGHIFYNTPTSPTAVAPAAPVVATPTVPSHAVAVRPLTIQPALRAEPLRPDPAVNVQFRQAAPADSLEAQYARKHQEQAEILSLRAPVPAAPLRLVRREDASAHTDTTPTENIVLAANNPAAAQQWRNPKAENPVLNRIDAASSIPQGYTRQMCDHAPSMPAYAKYHTTGVIEIETGRLLPEFSKNLDQRIAAASTWKMVPVMMLGWARDNGRRYYGQPISLNTMVHVDKHVPDYKRWLLKARMPLSDLFKAMAMASNNGAADAVAGMLGRDFYVRAPGKDLKSGTWRDYVDAVNYIIRKHGIASNTCVMNGSGHPDNVQGYGAYPGMNGSRHFATTAREFLSILRSYAHKAPQEWLAIFNDRDGRAVLSDGRVIPGHVRFYPANGGRFGFAKTGYTADAAYAGVSSQACPGKGTNYILFSGGNKTPAARDQQMRSLQQQLAAKCGGGSKGGNQVAGR